MLIFYHILLCCFTLFWNTIKKIQYSKNRHICECNITKQIEYLYVEIDLVVRNLFKEIYYILE